MIDVQKYHGTGNDFVVVDAAADVPDRRAFARVLCDRRTGIEHEDSPRTGADGVLFLALEDEYCPSRIVMTLVQPDGSVAPMCGNGARCAAAWAAGETDCEEVMIDTQSGTRRATIEGDEVTIEMGAPTFDPAKVPVDADDPLIEAEVEGLTVTAVNTGVPHAVAFVDDVDAVDLADVAPAVRYADVFPEGTNVTLAAEDGDVHASDSEGGLDGREASVGGYRQRTYERGVEGETDSCGTGAVAVAAVAHRLGELEADQPVRVSPPGGDLEVTVSESGSTLRGPAVVEFRERVDARPSPSAPADD